MAGSPARHWTSPWTASDAGHPGLGRASPSYHRLAQPLLSPAYTFLFGVRLFFDMEEMSAGRHSLQSGAGPPNHLKTPPLGWRSRTLSLSGSGQRALSLDVAFPPMTRRR